MNNTSKKQTKGQNDSKDSSPIRISAAVKLQLETEIENLKKKKIGSRKISPSQIIDKLLPLLTDEIRQEIIAESVTPEDRERVALSNFLKKHKGSKKSQFKDRILYGEIKVDDYLPPEMRRTKKAPESNDLRSA